MSVPRCMYSIVVSKAIDQPSLSAALMLTNIQIKDSIRDSNIILPVKILTKFIKCPSHQTTVVILLLLLIDIITFNLYQCQI